MDSYLTILNRMKDKYTELSGYNVPDGSDIDIRMKLLAGEIFNSEANLDFIKRQMFASTANGEYLDAHAQDRGLSRKSAVKATGTASFYVNEAREESIIIPEGTIISTSGSTVCRFLTAQNATLNAGALSVSVPCIAETGGALGNISAGAITVMVTNIIGIDGVANAGDFSGGADSEDDEALRKRILDTYISVSNGTNAAYYKKLAENVDGVKSAKVVPRVRGAGTVNVNIAGFGEPVSQSKVNEVQALLNEKRELNVDVLVVAAVRAYVSLGFTLTLKAGYDFSEVRSAVAAAVENYINSLGVGENVVDTHLGRVILGVEGVYDYYWMDNYTSYYTIADNAFAVLSSVNIQEET